MEKNENGFLENMKHEINQNIKEVEEEEEILKKRISSHPLYGLLLHSHLNCLKVRSLSLCYYNDLTVLIVLNTNLLYVWTHYDQVCSDDFDSPEIMNAANDFALTKLSLHSDSSPEATSSELDQFMVLLLLLFPFFYIINTSFRQNILILIYKLHFCMSFI